ncbi:MAG: hypothetical protein JSV91_11625 [Phycisphaerales bacterium]|nr:MAG: hypothetical protein JSV91_11625 [Phycisphaerales bacterium]
MCQARLFHVVLSVAAFFWATLASTADAQPIGYEGYQVVRITVGDDADVQKVHDLQKMLARDFQVWSEVVKIGPVEVRVAPMARLALAASGLRYEVTIEDLQQHIDRLYSGGRGFFDSLQTYDAHVQFMNDLVAAHPDLAQMVDLGQSVQGRTMWAIRITGPGTVKPGLMYHGAEHGNEQAGASVVVYAADYLLTNYDTDPDVAALVDNVEWYILPIMNPDGYVAYDRWNAHGVDLNRNWDGPGAGQDPWGGPYPFSEPETQNMRDFFLAHFGVRVHIDFHGYVPWIMWPWAHIPDHSPDHDQYYVLGAEYRDLVAAAGGGYYDIGTIYNVAYPVSGCSTNWVYGVEDRWSFSIETIDYDMPETCEEFLDGQLMLAEWIRSYDCNGNGVVDSEDIANQTSEDVNNNGVPDECECPADVNSDAKVNIDDVFAVLGAWGPCDDCPEDVNADGAVDIDDISAVLDGWGPCD